MKLDLPQLNKTLSCAKGENLFRVLKDQGIAIASSCQGDGVCGKCVLTITKGATHLSPPTDLEIQLTAKYQYSEQQRISCQCQLQGDESAQIEVKSTYW